MLTHCLDEFEVAIFLREIRTRHSLLTRNKTFHRPGQDLNQGTKAEDVSGDRTVNPANSADGEIMIESDSEPDLELHNIPETTDEVASRDMKRTHQVQPENDAGSDEKKLRFTTNYESFNIHGWVLCLLITRKGKTRPTAVESESTRQPLMEEWISTQAQPSLED